MGGPAPVLTTSALLERIWEYCRESGGRHPTILELVEWMGIYSVEQVREKLRRLRLAGYVHMNAERRIVPAEDTPAGPIKVEHWTPEQIEAHFKKLGIKPGPSKRRRSAQQEEQAEQTATDEEVSAVALARIKWPEDQQLVDWVEELMQQGKPAYLTIASELGCSPGSVSTRVAKARARLIRLERERKDLNRPALLTEALGDASDEVLRYDSSSKTEKPSARPTDASKGIEESVQTTANKDSELRTDVPIRELAEAPVQDLGGRQPAPQEAPAKVDSKAASEPVQPAVVNILLDQYDQPEMVQSSDVLADGDEWARTIRDQRGRRKVEVWHCVCTISVGTSVISILRPGAAQEEQGAA